MDVPTHVYLFFYTIIMSCGELDLTATIGTTVQLQQLCQ